MNQAIGNKKYQLSTADRAKILFGADRISYPEKLSPARIEREERRVQAALPSIPGMAECSTEEKRIDLYKATVEFQRASFAAVYGDDFGCKASAPAPKKDVVCDSTAPAMLKFA